MRLLKQMLCKHDYYQIALLVYSTETYKCKICTLKCKKCKKKKDIKYNIERNYNEK